MVHPLVSIIIPVFNSELYLRRCINSVLNQSYGNIEILLIDDGSTDNSREIMEELANEDSRIMVLSQENRGAGAARNLGLLNSVGSYVCFFDADDSIEKETIMKAIRVVLRDQSELVMFGYDKVDIDGRLISRNIPLLYKYYFEKEEVISFLLPQMISGKRENGNLWLSCATNMYSRELLIRSDFKFKDVNDIYSEDAFATLELFPFIHSVSVIDECLYHYYQNDNSSSHTINLERYDSLPFFYSESLSIYSKEQFFHEIKTSLSMYIFNQAIGILKTIVNSQKENNKIKVIRIFLVRSQVPELIIDADISAETIKRKIIFYAIEKKLSFLCYILAKASR